ncbi:MAG: SH3 domain-containing protein [Chloroflexota bacterium]|nr:SH3 domain-containing protein [Chloroflexota bacterium]
MWTRGRWTCVATCLAALLLTSCGVVIPPQPSGSAAPAPAVSTPAPSSPPGKKVATVSGTGRFGLSIRKLPGLDAERIATVPDGYQAAIVGGPVSQDGAQWFKLQGADVTGWASGTYLTIGTGVPPSPVSSANPNGSPLTGILSRLSRETNYDVGGNGIFVQPELKAATDHLAASPTGEAVLQKAAKAYVRITAAHLQSSAEGGEFSTLGHSIKIGDTMLSESTDVQSTVLSHELQHAADILVDHQTPESSQSCVNLELRAFRTQEKVWLELTKPSPPKTKIESEFDQLSHVVDSPVFAQKLAQLYAGECGKFSKH